MFSCRQCPELFESEISLKSHSDKIHSEPHPTFTCGDCKTDFNNLQAFEYHLKNVKCQKVGSMKQPPVPMKTPVKGDKISKATSVKNVFGRTFFGKSFHESFSVS